MVANVM